MKFIFVPEQKAGEKVTEEKMPVIFSKDTRSEAKTFSEQKGPGNLYILLADIETFLETARA